MGDGLGQNARTHSLVFRPQKSLFSPLKTFLHFLSIWKLLIPATTKFDSNSTNKFQKGTKSFEYISEGMVHFKCKSGRGFLVCSRSRNEDPHDKYRDHVSTLWWLCASLLKCMAFLWDDDHRMHVVTRSTESRRVWRGQKHQVRFVCCRFVQRVPLTSVYSSRSPLNCF